MNEPLVLIDQLLAKVRQLENQGCQQEAQRLLTRLANFRDLPEPVALEVRNRLARLFLRQHRFGAARHHLTAASAPAPPCLHPLFAGPRRQTACPEDLQRAADHLRQAVQLAPRRPRYWVAYGKMLLKQGKLAKGLRCLRARKLAPGDVGVLTRVVRGLIRAEQWQEARQTVQDALFLLPRCPAVAKLWSDVRFQERGAGKNTSAISRPGERRRTLVPRCCRSCVRSRCP